ncbi:uncharacterized protein LOC135386377 isoform X2 [Ornithodoros turicata]
MTPKKKGEGHTTIKMERVAVPEVNSDSVMHVAGGDHKGIVINKLADDDETDEELPELSLEFRVFLTNITNDTHTRESRQLRFWFKANVTDQRHTAQEFFKELVSPSQFPRDYVGFIKKIMKLMQIKYLSIRKVEIDMKQLETISEPPTRPTRPRCILLSVVDHNVAPLPDGFLPALKEGGIYHARPANIIYYKQVSMEDSMLGSKTELTQDRVLEIIESAYPNPVSLDEIASNTQSAEEAVHFHLRELLAKNVVKEMGNGSFTRVVQNDTEVTLVKQMPTVHGSQQPTIAIITAQYCEKVAVDAMIENKNTFVRYKTEGESNVYTLGNIGAHRVVSTKLPAVGNSRGAVIASGNTTTRLLGTFQKVEYVFLVGVGGGVPHYTDHRRHVRLGDIVASCPSDSYPYAYLFAEHFLPEHPGTTVDPSIKTWCPPLLKLQEVAQQLWEQGAQDHSLRPWDDYIKDGIEALSDQESDFNRPPPETDRLYMSIGGKDVIEVAHPSEPTGESNIRVPGSPVVHFGAVGSGYGLLGREDGARHAFAEEHGIVALDTGFNTVADSICGSRKDHYMFVRGIADYKDGSKKKDWQPYSALAAAAFVKSVICALEPEDDN